MVSIPNPTSALDRVRKEIERNALRARNGIKIVAGVSKPNPGASAKDVVWRAGRCELWHYRNDAVTLAPPVLIIYSLLNRSYILDLAEGNSFIQRLLGSGFDVYMLDWGIPDERDADNTFEDYVDDFIPTAVDRIREISGSDTVNMLGYCFGGLLAVLYAGHHPDAPLRSLTVMTTPTDLQELGPMGDALGASGLDIEDTFNEDGNIAPDVLLAAFRSLTPTADVTAYVNLWQKMWDEDYVAAHQSMSGWGNEHIPFPGGVARQMVTMMTDNALVNDRIVIGGDRVHLSDITIPFLHVTADRDHIIPEKCSAPLVGLVGSAEAEQFRLPAGHVGLVVGKTAHKTTIPKIIDFMRKRSEEVTR
ncbi:alpha/beta fold hydrolase [Gordonia sp. TBRC 11910]|uniref:Alpha/beta fold hydrolase n=1 Tax=Gordonia asplenii TaxID=2725283 RepID=A0A848KPD6_9ACTN|nr:alpha/beta fold hydrolase [Gordonia asplenii]